MPRKKSKKRSNNRAEKAQAYSAESYKSLLYGMVTVLVFFVLVFLGLKLIAHKTSPSIGENGISTHSAQNLYVVKKGDTLSMIAKAKYQNGNLWTEIAKANNILNPNSIEVGTRLTIPALPTPTVALTAATTISQAPPKEAQQVTNEDEEYGGKITGKSYEVVKGDYLWEIAERAYGDPYKWVDIAKANNLANPDLIFSGNNFIIPR